MKIYEVASPLPDLKDKIGLMTKEEFLNYRNEKGKMHPSDAYQTNIKLFNNSQRGAYNYRDNGIEVYIYHHDNDYYVIEQDNKKVGVYHNDTLYYTIHYDTNVDLSLSRETPFVKPKNKVKVKYLTNIISTLDNIVSQNMQRFPHIMKRVIVDGEQLSIRSEKQYVKNKGYTIVVMNSTGYIIAMASDEWGTTLLRVADEYKGKNLGEILGEIWYELNPDFKSGGFTQSGMRNALKIWARQVRKFLQNGWYSELVKQGKISKEKVNEILKDLPAKYKPTKSNIKNTKDKPDILIYSDNESTITVYDKKFYEDYDPKYIYGHAFLRDTYKNDYFIFSIDYLPQYRKLTSFAIFQLAKNLGENLYIKDKPSDHLEIDDYPEIIQDGDYAFLQDDVLPLKDFAKVERMYRKKLDPYGEGFNHLISSAESKWK